MAGYVFIMLCDYYRVHTESLSSVETFMNFTPSAFLYTGILIIICYLTGETPSWRWGKMKK